MFRSLFANNPVLVGRWQRRHTSSALKPEVKPDLLVIVAHSKLSEASILLAEALRALEPLPLQAALLQRLEQRQQELAHRNMLIRDLIYAFSHDLRTPLTANAMHMRLAQGGAYGSLSEEYRRALHNGLQANQDLLELADSLLLLARLESGEQRSNPDVYNMATLVHAAVEHLRPMAQEKAICLAVNLQENSRFEVLGQASELRRALHNLLTNALKFSPPQSRIELRLTSEAGYVCLDVADEGPGIPEDQRPRLFQRFSSGRAGGGSGLGLYLTKSIAASARRPYPLSATSASRQFVSTAIAPACQ